MATEDQVRLETENVDLRRLLAKAGTDASEQQGLARLQRLLMEELHHRVKNTLATVMAITSQSLRGAESLEHGRLAIEHRLLALGRAHDLLLQTTWTSAKLATILKAAIEPFDSAGIVGRFIVRSPDIDVNSAAVLPLAMALNELATNAVKYGALSNATGHVEIVATVDTPREQFHLRWSEKDGPRVGVPTRRGFGTKLIERSFIKQLNGEARLSFEPSGLVCVLDIPLASIKPAQSLAA